MSIRPFPEWFTTAFKFGLKGGAGVAVGLVLLTLLVEYVGVSEAAAVPIAWVITLVPGYLATDKLVFNKLPSPDSVASHSHRGTLHYAVMWSGKGLNYAIYLVLLNYTPIYQAAWFIGAVAVFPWTFGWNYWFWKTNPQGVRDAARILRERMAAALAD